MAYGEKINTSLYGRRFGLQAMSSAVSGTGQSGRTMEFMVGPDAFRSEYTTADTTATYLKPFGVSVISSANSASTNPVYRLDPPIPGVNKTIVFLSTAATVASTVDIMLTFSTGGGEVLRSSWSSSFTVLRSTTPFVLNLFGLTTAMWGTQNSSATFVGAATTST